MHLRRQAAVLVLAFILAAPWLAAAGPRPEIHEKSELRVSSVSEFLNQAWSLLQSLWGAAADCDAGPRMDPLGCPQPSAGPRMDPLG